MPLSSGQKSKPHIAVQILVLHATPFLPHILKSECSPPIPFEGQAVLIVGQNLGLMALHILLPNSCF